ncbi:hypothetical protein BDK51DRAFT_30997 [Blyttiomyces helicus]|uniref:Uncharacterized protein n=1 Tax=Blyttiomyces helicus TaxID=388810 RepID=A0A4V1IRR4_9FUNG|nr:hypothetical protein BDK51DRAFT_30997 [Blyttiomyces helicus]|eukprot:RKO90967.1 hypothetical protein BDK51DRAFT_30997 [Blyttiomyces helicus]
MPPAALQMVQAPPQALKSGAQKLTLPGRDLGGDGEGGAAPASMAWATRVAGTAAMTGRTRQVGAQEASCNCSAWGGGPADQKDADKDKELWEDDAADENETGDGHPTASCYASQGGADSDIEVGRKNVNRTQPPPAPCSQPGAGASRWDEATLYGRRKSDPHGSALARLLADVRGLKCLGMRATLKLDKVESVKLPAPLPPVPMISLLDMARFGELHFSSPNVSAMLQRTPTCSCSSFALSQHRRRCLIGVRAARRPMGSEAKIVAIIGGPRKASLTALTASAAKFFYPMSSYRTCHALMPISILDNPQFDLLRFHTCSRILEADLALLANGMQMRLYVKGKAVLPISVPYGILSNGPCPHANPILNLVYGPAHRAMCSCRKLRHETVHTKNARDLVKDYGDVATAAEIGLSSNSPSWEWQVTCSRIGWHQLRNSVGMNALAVPPQTPGDGNCEPSEMNLPLKELISATKQLQCNIYNRYKGVDIINTHFAAHLPDMCRLAGTSRHDSTCGIESMLGLLDLRVAGYSNNTAVCK